MSATSISSGSKPPSAASASPAQSAHGSGGAPPPSKSEWFFGLSPQLEGGAPRLQAVPHTQLIKEFEIFDEWRPHLLDRIEAKFRSIQEQWDLDPTAPPPACDKSELSAFVAEIEKDVAMNECRLNGLTLRRPLHEAVHDKAVTDLTQRIFDRIKENMRVLRARIQAIPQQVEQLCRINLLRKELNDLYQESRCITDEKYVKGLIDALGRAQKLIDSSDPHFEGILLLQLSDLITWMQDNLIHATALACQEIYACVLELQMNVDKDANEKKLIELFAKIAPSLQNRILEKIRALATLPKEAPVDLLQHLGSLAKALIVLGNLKPELNIRADRDALSLRVRTHLEEEMNFSHLPLGTTNSFYDIVGSLNYLTDPAKPKSAVALALLKREFYRLSENIQKKIILKMGELQGKPVLDFRKFDPFTDLPSLKLAIAELGYTNSVQRAFRTLLDDDHLPPEHRQQLLATFMEEWLPTDERNRIYANVWRLAGQPTGDPQFGKHHAVKDLTRLKKATGWFSATGLTGSAGSFDRSYDVKDAKPESAPQPTPTGVTGTPSIFTLAPTGAITGTMVASAGMTAPSPAKPLTSSGPKIGTPRYLSILHEGSYVGPRNRQLTSLFKNAFHRDFGEKGFETDADAIAESRLLIELASEQMASSVTPFQRSLNVRMVQLFKERIADPCAVHLQYATFLLARDNLVSEGHFNPVYARDGLITLRTELQNLSQNRAVTVVTMGKIATLLLKLQQDILRISVIVRQHHALELHTLTYAIYDWRLDPKAETAAAAVKKVYEQLPKELRQKLEGKVWELAQRPAEADFGAKHALDDLHRLHRAVTMLATEVLSVKSHLCALSHMVGQANAALKSKADKSAGALERRKMAEELRRKLPLIIRDFPSDVQNAIYGRIWELHGKPSGDFNFGQNNLTTKLKHLATALRDVRQLSPDPDYMCEHDSDDDAEEEEGVAPTPPGGSAAAANAAAPAPAPQAASAAAAGSAAVAAVQLAPTPSASAAAPSVPHPFAKALSAIEDFKKTILPTLQSNANNDLINARLLALLEGTSEGGQRLLESSVLNQLFGALYHKIKPVVSGMDWGRNNLFRYLDDAIAILKTPDFIAKTIPQAAS